MAVSRSAVQPTIKVYNEKTQPVHMTALSP